MSVLDSLPNGDGFGVSLWETRKKSPEEKRALLAARTRLDRAKKVREGWSPAQFTEEGASLAEQAAEWIARALQRGSEALTPRDPRVPVL